MIYYLIVSKLIINLAIIKREGEGENGDYTEALTIGVIVLCNGLMGFFQEYKTERTLEALRKMAAPKARVYRDGVLKEVPGEELVRGDVIAVVTGEGSFDAQSLGGKAISGVAGRCQKLRVPAAVLAGRVALTPEQWAPLDLRAVRSINPAGATLEDARVNAAAYYRTALETLLKEWK